jgi:hypothetical protein
MTIDKFSNLILLNINKLKPYRFMEDDTFQLILVKPNDFLLEEPVGITNLVTYSLKNKLR